MDLKRRLDTLRAQSGTDPVQKLPPAVPDTELTQRLARLQHTRRHTQRRREPLDDAGLARLTEGRLIAEGLVLVEQQLPLPHPGLAELCTKLPHLPDAAGLQVADWVFIDTETSGLAGGTGTIAFMLGLARASGEFLTVRQYLLGRFAGERPMLEHALGWLGDDTGLVSYNGKSFDLPLLKTRSRLAGMPAAVWDRPHIDLLYAVRRAFESRWPDCRLATAEQRLLGVRRHDDLPGSEAPAAWLAHLKQGDASRLPGVLHHNRQDLVSLAGLLPILADVHRQPADRGGDVVRVARRWLRDGGRAQARAVLEDGLTELGAEGRLLLAALRQREGETLPAKRLLEALADSGSAEATERLAKLHEHITRDLRAAQRYARALPYSPEREHRLTRLECKRGRNRELPF
jgi:uncharacterized protein